MTLKSKEQIKQSREFITGSCAMPVSDWLVFNRIYDQAERVEELSRENRAIIAKCYPLIKGIKGKTDEMEIFLRTIHRLSQKNSS